MVMDHRLLGMVGVCAIHSQSHRLCKRAYAHERPRVPRLQQCAQRERLTRESYIFLRYIVMCYIVMAYMQREKLMRERPGTYIVHGLPVGVSGALEEVDECTLACDSLASCMYCEARLSLSLADGSARRVRQDAGRGIFATANELVSAGFGALGALY